MKLDPRPRQHFRRSQHIFVVPVAPHGDYMRMLDEEKLIADFAALTPLDQSPLKLERFCVTDPAQVTNLAGRGPAPTLPPPPLLPPQTLIASP